MSVASFFRLAVFAGLLLSFPQPIAGQTYHTFGSPAFDHYTSMSPDNWGAPVRPRRLPLAFNGAIYQDTFASAPRPWFESPLLIPGQRTNRPIIADSVKPTLIPGFNAYRQINPIAPTPRNQPSNFPAFPSYRFQKRSGN